jgi:polyisoprenoid-binding protein YceI
MKRVFVFTLLFAFLLSACGGAQGTEIATLEPAATEAAALPETGIEEPTEAPVVEVATATGAATPTTAAAEPATETAPATTAPTEAGGAGAGLAIYSIVPEESRVTYEVNETFLDGNRLGTAVGVTQGIEGEFQVDRANPQNSQLGTVTIDISQLTSDSGRRDNALRDRFLQSAQFPLAVFAPTSIEGFPAAVQEGVDIPLTISGDLTIREVTRPVTFDTVVRLESDRITGQALTTILMSDYGFGPISVAGMLNTEDEVKVTFDFVARPVG